MCAVQTIHVIDDDAIIRISLQALLEAEGYIVRGHDSAQTFLETIQNADFGCIVTDVNMPHMSGIELLVEMRKLRIGIPAIMISGFMDARLKKTGEEQGAFRCFQKPVDLDALLATIHAALVHTYGRNQNSAFSG
jgi:two-component system, LuxR family, response regulator FixJ